jgi:hypothetical protein
MRTFKVEFIGGAASCFVINHRDRQWLITAKHVADAAVKNGVAALTLTGENGLDVEMSGPLAPGPDIAVFDLGGKKIVRDDMTLVPSADGIMLSQEVFFLGYPLTGTLPLMGRLPAVRRGIVCPSERFWTVSPPGSSTATTCLASPAARSSSPNTAASARLGTC